MTLSKRLKQCASYVKKGAIVQDVGTDHGLVPLYLIQNGVATKVYATDLKEGPLSQAKKNIPPLLDDLITLKLSDGIQDLTDDVDTVMISGMGGRLISDILMSPLKNIKHLILQPNMGSHILRQTLQDLGFSIEDEAIIYENEQYYEVLYASRGTMNLSKQEIQFGPILLKERSNLFLSMWTEELQRVEYAMSHVPVFHENYKTLEQKKMQIEEIL